MGEPTVEEIRAARARLEGVVRPTPSFFSHSLSALLGHEVWLKPEFRQRTGSFKIRGAYLLQSQLDPGCEVVAASAGNHAQGVALAAGLLGQRATIYMPSNASLPKVQATRAYGADVELGGLTTDDAIVAAVDHATRTGGIYIPPFDHPQVIAGQGTIGLEILDEVPDVANVVVAIGGGGLCAGIAIAMGEHISVIGAVAAGANSIMPSLEAGRPVDITPRTIADGIALRMPSELTLSIIASRVEQIVAVAEEDISRAILLLLERAKAVVEPAGAVGLAALLGEVELREGPTVVVLGGGNVDPLLLSKLVEHGLSAAGRFLVVRVVMDDRPGSLALLTDAVATMGLNVLDVEHHRSGLRLQLGSVEVLLTVETRDHAHRMEVLRSLIAAGFNAEIVE